MVWQDIVITIVIISFSYALLPQIYQGFKQKKGFINLQTSGITGSGMYILSVMYFTLELYFSSLMVFIGAILWTILFIQKIIYK
jgi:hypothetical protein|tara:strand:+ start:1357 stop:1608 length:252 start_codon:yes stop_codon:yes gene_type:complete